MTNELPAASPKKVPSDSAESLARELPISIAEVRHRLEVLGHSPERIRAEVTLEAVGLPVPSSARRWRGPIDAIKIRVRLDL